MSKKAFSNIILVFGLPRSGTTWIAKFFDSHPDTSYRHEPDRYAKLDIPPLVSPALTDQYREKIRAYADELVDLRNYRVRAKFPLFKKSYISRSQFYLYKLSAYLSKIQSRTSADPDLFYVPPTPNSSSIRLAWKSINSVGRIGLISTALDGCKTVLIIRHPCGQINSLLKADDVRRSKGKPLLSEDYKLFEMLVATEVGRRYGLTMEHIKSITPVERFAWEWVVYNEKALHELSQGGDRMVVHYEAVCDDPEKMARSMFEFAGLDVGAQTLNFIRRSTQKHDDSYFGVYKDPKDSAYKWKRELSQEQIDRIKATATKTVPWRYVTR